MKHIQLIIVSILLTLAATSCSNDESYSYGNSRYDMVTYMGWQEGEASFSYQGYDDSPVLSLVAPMAQSPDLSVGQRIMIDYAIDDTPSATSQRISINGYTKAITDSLRYTAHENIPTIHMDSIKLKSIWRTGDYINIYSQVRYTTQSRIICLLMDKSTWSNDTVHCYLVHDMMGADAYFWRRCYTSFYVGAAWHLPSCHTIRVHINDLTYPDVDYYDFTKN